MNAPRTATVAATDANTPPLTPSTQTVGVLEQAVSAEPPSIPVTVRDYLAGRGFRVVPACVLPQEMNRRSRARSHPLRAEDFADADRAKMVAALREAGFHLKDGVFRRADTAVYIQPQDEYLSRGEDALARWRQQLPNDALAASTLGDIAGEELTTTGLVSIYTREELNRRTQ